MASANVAPEYADQPLRQSTYPRRSANRALFASTSRDVHALQIKTHSSEIIPS
jgi:hypothetical protein